MVEYESWHLIGQAIAAALPGSRDCPISPMRLNSAARFVVGLSRIIPSVAEMAQTPATGSNRIAANKATRRSVMKSGILGAAVALAVAAGGAVSVQAADLSPAYRSPPPLVSPIYSWTGCYIGVSAGGVGGHSSFSTWGAGGLAGGQLGCNYQIEHLVVGVEGEGDWIGLNMQTSTAPPLVTTSDKTRWAADVALRLGLAFDHFLIYSKVGAIWVDNRFVTSAPTSTTSGNETLPGVIGGLGVEYAFTPQWIARFEADLVFTNSTSATFVCSGVACVGGPTTASENDIMVLAKAGLSYKFGY
jgi:outer membrane immunogenic protein